MSTHHLPERLLAHRAALARALGIPAERLEFDPTRNQFLIRPSGVRAILRRWVRRCARAVRAVIGSD